MPYYSVLLTRDCTESAQVLVKAADKKDAFDAATTIVKDDQWSLDEGNLADAYLGDSENSIEKIRRKEFNRLKEIATRPVATSEAMTALLEEAVNEWPQFDNGEDVPGTDIVDWFSDFRSRIQKLLGIEPELSTCDDCAAQVPAIIGCPDGAEVCQACFDAGAH